MRKWYRVTATNGDRKISYSYNVYSMIDAIKCLMKDHHEIYLYRKEWKFRVELAAERNNA